MLPEANSGHWQVYSVQLRFSHGTLEMEPETVPKRDSIEKVIQEWQAQLHHREHFFPA